MVEKKEGMLEFIRSDLAALTAYTPHPGGTGGKPAAPVAEILDRLDTNESPYDLPDDLKQKLAWAYQQELENNRYPDGGHTALRWAISEYVNESAGLPPGAFTPKNISVGNGSDELIRSLLIATCLKGEGSILVANPTFSMYTILAQSLAVPVVSVGRSSTTFETNLVEAQSAIEQTQNPPIRVVFVVHPNSPTGNPLTEAELNWLRSLPANVLVVVDEAYFEFSQNTLLADALQRPNWVILRTFSKAFRLATHRVGYAIAHPELVVALEKVRLPYNLPGFSQTAARFALAHRNLLLSMVPGLLAERNRMFQALQQHPALEVWASSTNFLYLRLRAEYPPERGDLGQVCQELKQMGTLVRYVSHGLRITIGTPEENQRTLMRLQTVLASKFSS